MELADTLKCILMSLKTIGWREAEAPNAHHKGSLIGITAISSGGRITELT